MDLLSLTVGWEGWRGRRGREVLRKNSKVKGWRIEGGGRGKYPPNSEIVGSWMGFSGFMK